MLRELVTGGTAGDPDDDPLDEKQWKNLLRWINTRTPTGNKCECTPFIGSGACDQNLVPPPWKIAQEWSSDAEYQFRFGDTTDLPRVAQYYAANELFPKDKLRDTFENVRLADFPNPDDVHRRLAALPFHSYICTHYFNFMTEALKEQKKKPQSKYYRGDCVPNPAREQQEQEYEPSAATPLVYNLFGSLEEPASMVMTEDDYLDFLVKTASAPTTQRSGQEDEPVIPNVVDLAMKQRSLLFLGYRLNDLEFRVLLRMLMCNRGQQFRYGTHFTVQTVQIVADDNSTDSEQIQDLQDFVNKYFEYNRIKVNVYPGSLAQFVTKLHQRWENFDAKTVRVC